MTSPHPEAYPEFPHQNKRHSCHLGNYKVFRKLVSGARVKDQILEQKMLLVLLPLRKFQGFQELCASKWQYRPVCIFHYFIPTKEWFHIMHFQLLCSPASTLGYIPTPKCMFFFCSIESCHILLLLSIMWVNCMIFSSPSYSTSLVALHIFGSKMNMNLSQDILWKDVPCSSKAKEAQGS